MSPPNDKRRRDAESAPTPSESVARLVGLAMPSIPLASTDGGEVTLKQVPDRAVLYLYPLMSRPGVAQPSGWDDVPGARGCTSEACQFRDHHAELLEAGAGGVFGLSSQILSQQREAVTRLRLPFPLLSDPALALADALSLPTFSVVGHPRLYTRLTLIVSGGLIEHVFYPIPAPGEHAGEVRDWLMRADMPGG